MKVGDKVLCQFFNWPEGRFYGDTFEGEVIDIDFNNERGMPYLIKRKELPDVWMAGREVIRKGDNK